MVIAAAVLIPMGAFLLDRDLKPCALGEAPVSMLAPELWVWKASGFEPRGPPGSSVLACE